MGEIPEQPSMTTEAASYDGALWRCVRRLPERQRKAVALRYVLDLPHADVARLLGKTPTMSRRLVSDALATLRRHVVEEVES